MESMGGVEYILTIADKHMFYIAALESSLQGTRYAACRLSEREAEKFFP